MLDVEHQGHIVSAEIFAIQRRQNQADELHCESLRPFNLYRPKLTQDGDAWVACLGTNLQEGVVGCGPSPSEAAYAFDRAWYEKSRSRSEL